MLHICRVFPKVDHSARSDRIVLVEYTTGSVVELNFCQRFAKDLTRFWQIIIKQMVNFYQDLTRFWHNNIEQMVNIYQIFGKVLFNHK